MMAAAVWLPDGQGPYPADRLDEIRSRVDRLTELQLGAVAEAVGDLRHLVAEEISEPIPDRPGWVETSYPLVAGGAEEVREFLTRAVDEVLGPEPHPHVTELLLDDEWWALSGGVSGGDDPTDAYGWIVALNDSAVLLDDADTGREEAGNAEAGG